MSSSAHRSHDPRVEPARLVSIDARRHIPKESTRTRLGVGDQFIDHAAGRPLDARQSFPGIPAPAAEPALVEEQRRATRRHYVIAPASSDDWADQPSLHDRQRLAEALNANEAPVDLPLRSRATVYLVVGGLIAAFIAIFVATLFAGATSRVTLPAEPPASAPAAPAAP